MAGQLKTLITLLLSFTILSYVNGDEPPRFITDITSLQLREDLPLGTEILVLNGYDAEGPVHYALYDDISQELLDVNSVNGSVKLKKSLDREVNPHHEVIFSVVDNMGQQQPMETSIYVLDVNDNAPVFENTPYKVSISENVTVGTTIFEISATDSDSGRNGIIFFSFSTEINSFSIPSPNRYVIINQPLDYEDINIYELTIVATDQGIPQQSSEASLIIKVTDVQDNPPMFTGLPYTTSVDENSPTTLVVQTVRAFDQDIGLSNQISYSIVSASVPELFTINADTGEIRGQRLIDREAEGFPGYVTLTVEALEVGPDGGDSAQTEFTITINDVNDESPLFSQAEYSITVSENAHIALPLDIHVRDRDQGEFSTISLSLHGQYSELFRLEPSRVLGEADVIILVDHPLDYETAVQYQLYIYANETADITHFDMTRVRITLINENDNRPIFSSQSITVDVKEDLPVGSNVTMVTATDDDIGIYGDITYTISGADQFIIDAELGVISLIQSIDYELSLRYQLTVRAEDGGNPAEADNTRVIINVIDVNDNPPVFKDSEYFATIEENTVYLNKSIVRIRATDRDSAPYNQITYHILDAPSEDQFSVTTDGVNGFVFVNTPVDYEELIDGGLTLTLSAEDLDGLSDVAVLYIEVLDKNDHGPEFTHQTYNVSVFEDIQTSDTVTTVTAIDGDMSSAVGTESIVYSVSQPGVFRINPGTGEITTTTFLDRDMGVDSYIVQVLAVDGGHGNEQKTATSMVYITILDVNDNNPVFENVRQTVYIAEDQPIDTVIGNVTASDLDFGMNGDIIYSFISGNTDDVFSIGLFDGEILIKKELDYDDLYQVYILEILAHDQGVPVDPATGSATATVTVSVIDVNDNSPVFEYTVYQFAVSEEADPGITIGMIRATDMDSTTNAYIDYNITDGNIDGSFNMKRVGSGEIILERQLDRENIDMYGLTVIASDRGIPRHSAVCYVTIIVRDVNDNDPIWIDEPYMTTISEDVDNGTYVFQVSAIDADIGSNQLLVYEINPFTPYFKVDSASGVITTTDVPLDREMNTAQEIILTVKDSGRPLRRSSHSAIVHVTVLDINDNVPVFEDTPYIGSVVENQPAGTSVIQVSASDLDFGENGTVSYFIVSLEPNTNNFDMNSSTGLITLTHPLDREYIQAYNITIQARDGGMDPNVAIATVQIEIEDDNDHSPLFTANSYEVSVLENATRGTSLIVLSASDGDIGTNADINYFITHGNQDGKFQIHFQSGLVQTSAFLDREVVEEYNLTIEAIDNGVYAKTGTCYVTVNVLDINDNRPIFTESNYDVTVMENVTQDYTIVTVHALDADIGENAKITYAIIAGNTQNSFVIDSNYGDIRRNEQPLDRETEESYILTVEASNNDSNMFRSQVRVSMMVYDVNDEKPVFTQSVYYRPDLSESAGKGTSVILVSAEDPDLSDGGRVVYSITAGNDMDEFSIDSSTGLITTDAALDYETKNNYSLVVMAVDQSPPYHSGTASVVVIIVNINDEPPSFNQTRYYSTVKENVAIGTSVVKVTAVEYDNQNPIQYEFDPNTNPEAMALFTINIDNGLISTINEIDREIRGFYTITVLANDGGTEKGSTTVWITVLDKNDNAPIFDVFSDISVSVKEEMYTPVGSMIGRVKATDRDEGINAMVNYEIIDGDVDNMFNITTNTANEGIIKNIQLLDREVKDTYRLIVSAYDSGDVPLNTSMIVTIKIEDVNDNIPVFNMSYSYIVTLYENVGGGTIITTVYATDEDIGSNGVLKYYIVDGNTDGTFRMDRNTGEISTRPDPPDREKQDFYNLTVLAEDEGDDVIQQAYIQVLVHILDQNDNSPIFDPDIYSVSILEGAGSAGRQIVVVNATDEDIGDNSLIVYSISSGNQDDLFTIDAESGVISTNRELDREIADQYMLVVIATDQAYNTNERLTSTVTVTVTVLDINDIVPYFDASFLGVYEIAEDTSGPFIGTFRATDLDEGNNGHIQYSLYGDIYDEFSISPSDGDLRVRRGVELDRERIDIYNITLIATDMGNPPLSGSAVLQVIVSDINDNDPRFEGLPYLTEISEHTPINASIYQVRATDMDINMNAHITYSITNGDTDDIFTMDSLTGIVSVAKELDRETTSMYILTVTAKDNPENPTNARRDGTELIVTLLDENDQIPTFTQSLYSGHIEENSQEDNTVTMDDAVLAVDADFGNNSVITYSISGNGSQYFYIHQHTATIHVKETNSLDREAENIYRFLVTAIDIGGLNSSAEIVVNIVDVNDNSPVFTPSNMTVFIPENVVGGHVVMEVLAIDADIGLNQEVTYRVESGGQDKFTINPNTGLIKVAPGETLDREQRDQYTLVVIATDRGNPSQSGTGTVSIIVGDINDTPPSFTVLSQNFYLRENSPVGTTAAWVIAVDPDFDSLLQYSIVSIAAIDEEDNIVADSNLYENWFSINEFSGTVQVAGILDRENVSVFQLTISAVDLSSQYNGSRHSNPNAEVSIHLLDVNDNDPVFQPPGLEYIHEQLVEQSPLDTVVTTFTALDRDKGLQGMVRYEIVDNKTDLLQISDPAVGVITVNGVVDREIYQWLNFTVKAWDFGNPPRYSQIPVFVEILELNDNNPIFRQSLYETSVVENAIAGTEILVVIATDADSGSYGEVRYMLAGGAGKFTVDEITGAISLVHSLDREIQSEYTLTVTAKDNPTGLSSDRRENSVLVIVDVLDVNDNVPIPGAANYRFEILENVPVYSAVGTVVAHDADSGANGVLQYIISEVSEDDLFDINSSDGQIFTINSLDRESLGNKEMVSMVVKIQDQGVEHHEVTVPVLITVLDVNDNSPYFAYAMYNVTLSEDDFGGTLVYQFSAVDLDQDPVITYTLLDADLYSEFTVSEQTGALTTVSSLDHESRPEYLLTIKASDEDGNVGTTQLYIRVLDTNDQAPLFAITLYQFSVKENESVGSLVGQVVATDSDSVMEHSKIFYHIINGNPDNDFYLNENTGVVLINKQLNRESRAMYELEIEARNVADGIQSNVTLYDLATVIISIEDINDEAPVFTKQQYSRRILENEQIDTSIITVTAVDFDDGTNGEVYYAIEEGNYNDQFNIDSDSGVIYLAKLFQRNVDIDFQYDLVVSATDYGMPPLSNTTHVILDIVDVNDRKPVFINPPLNQSLNIPENQEPGYFITTVIATDGDLGDNGVVIYDFFKTEGDNEDWQNFYIDETRGDLYTTFTADRELKSFYTIVLLAKDLGEPQFESTQAVIIKVLDENDNIPIFSNVEVAQTMYISEHSTNGTIVGEIEQAIDLDEGDNAKVYYYFAGGNSDGYFEIDKTTGIIILMKEVDREKVNQFVLTVKASSDPDFGEDIEERRRREVIEPIDMNDINDPTLKTVVIKVVDINDNGPQFPRDEYTAGLSLDAKYESKLITVTAKDEDTGNNSIVYYSILSIYHLDTTTDLPPRVQPNAFKIGRLDGIIRTNELFVSFYHGYFELNVLAEDNGHKNDTAIVKIYMLKDNQRVKIVFNNDPDTVKEFTDQFISLIANITGALVHVDDIQYHISDTGGVDFKRTDMLIHAVDPNTNSIMDVHHIIELIDANYADLENFFKVYNVIEIVPAVPSREEDRISLLEAALVAIGIMLFIGVLIYIFCICWIRHKHKNKLEAIATFSYGASTSDLLRDSSYQGSNPLWIDNYSWISDWPESLSHFEREYEAQELTMDFFHDDDGSMRDTSSLMAKRHMKTFSPLPNGIDRRSQSPPSAESRSPSGSDFEIELIQSVTSGESDTDESPGVLGANGNNTEQELSNDYVGLKDYSIFITPRRMLTPISEEDSGSLTSSCKTDTMKTTGSRFSGIQSDYEEDESEESNDERLTLTVLDNLDSSFRINEKGASGAVNHSDKYQPLENHSSQDTDSESSSGSDGAYQIYHVNSEPRDFSLNIPLDDRDAAPLTQPQYLEANHGVENNAFEYDFMVFKSSDEDNSDSSKESIQVSDIDNRNTSNILSAALAHSELETFL